jgi:hypothetical protein
MGHNRAVQTNNAALHWWMLFRDEVRFLFNEAKQTFDI